MLQIKKSRTGVDRELIFNNPLPPGSKTYQTFFFHLPSCNNGILIPVFMNINDYFSNYFLIMEFYDPE